MNEKNCFASEFWQSLKLINFMNVYDKCQSDINECVVEILFSQFANRRIE